DVVFSEPVTGFATGDVVLSGTAGATTAIVTGSGATYTVAVSGMTSDGTVVALIPAGVATDAAANPNTASTSADNTVTFAEPTADTTPPTVTIDQDPAQADPTTVGPILFDVVFSEPVTGFDASDISFAGSTVGGTLLAGVTGGGANYTVAVNGMSGLGNVV